MEELRQQLSARSLTEILLSKALNEANEEKRKWKLEAFLKRNELELSQNDKKYAKENAEEDNVFKTNTTSKKYPLMKKVDLDVLSNLTQNNHKEKLIKAVPRSSSASDVVFVENIPVIDLDDDDDYVENRPGVKTILKTNRTETNELNNTHVGYKKEDIIRNSTEHNISVDGNKENDTGEDNSSEEVNDQNKKVTFSAKTFSPKKSAGLRKCKKVILCKSTVLKN